MKQKIFTWFKGVFSIIKPLHLIAAIGIVVFFWFLIMGDQGIYRLRQLLNMHSNLSDERSSIAHDVEQKEREKRLLEDPKNLEMIIRKELGYIKPGEIVFQEQEKK